MFKDFSLSLSIYLSYKLQCVFRFYPFNSFTINLSMRQTCHTFGSFVACIRLKQNCDLVTHFWFAFVVSYLFLTKPKNSHVIKSNEQKEKYSSVIQSVCIFMQVIEIFQWKKKKKKLVTTFACIAYTKTKNDLMNM